MAVSISDEDFQRLQNSLIDLKNENYNLQEKNRKQAKGAVIIFMFARHHIFYPVRSNFFQLLMSWLQKATLWSKS